MAILVVPEPIAFDPHNPSHLRFFAIFRKKGSWSGAPRFILEEGYSSIPEMINDKLLDLVLAEAA